MSHRPGWVRLVGPLLPLVPAVVTAQADRYAPIVLQLAATPRAAVLGNVAAARDIEAIFGNPAMLGVVGGTVTGFARYGAATLLSVASSNSLGSFSVGIGAQYLDAQAPSDRLPLWTYALNAGGHLPVSSAVGAFSLAMTVRGVRVGTALKYVDQRQGALQDGTPALDVGLAKDLSRFTAGVAVQNIGAGLHFPNTSAQLPLRVTAGVAGYGFTSGAFDLSGSAGASVLPDGLVLPAAGLEVGYVPMEGYNVVIRAGIRRPELRAQRPASFGGSAAFDRFTIEYAFEDWVGAGAHRLALRVR
jgi:hypothetical protein